MMVIWRLDEYTWSDCKASDEGGSSGRIGGTTGSSVIR